MANYQSYIPNYLGGICTIPSVSRTPSEVTDAENCLFSEARGCYKRPGTKRIVSNLAIDDEETMIEVFPVGKDVLQVVAVQNKKAHVFWINVNERETEEFVENHKNRLKEAEADLKENPENTEALNKKFDAELKLRQRGFYFNKNDELVDPQNPNTVFNSPVITTDTKPEVDYLELPDGQIPEETFRITKDQGRVFILNRDKKVELLANLFPKNTNFANHYLIYFVAITSGQDAKVTLEWEQGDEKKSQEVELGQVGIETVGEIFEDKWNELDTIPEGFEIQAEGQVATIRVKDFTIKNLKITVSNIADVQLKEEDGERSVPSFAALPPIAPSGMIVKVTGSRVTKLDDTWLRYEVNKEVS